MRNLISSGVASAATLAVAASVAATGVVAAAAPARPALSTPQSVARPAGARPDAITSNGVTTLFAGGATLPAIAYEGTVQAGLAPGLSSPTINPHSAFGFFTTLPTSIRQGGASRLTVSYCQTGSGFGKKVLGLFDFTTSAPLSAANPCPAIGVKPTDANGFGATIGQIRQNTPDFAGSDAPLSQTDYANFLNHRPGQPVQTPVIGGAVAIFFNNPDRAITRAPQLSNATLCRIASGQITNWNQIPDFSPALPSRPITFVYRADGSGTTFSFSNHLHAVCGSVLANNFGVSQNFAQSGTDFGALPAPGTVPANFRGASGNPGVTSTIASTPGAIGYVEAANAKVNLRPSAGVYYFLIHTGAYNSGTRAYDPYADVPTAGNTIGAAGSFVIGDQIPAPSGYGQGAVPAPLSPAPPNAACIVTVVPSAYASPSAGYPILGVTNLEFGSRNNTDIADLRLLPQMFFYGNALNSAYGSTRISTIDRAGTFPGAPAVSNPTTTGGTGFTSLQLSSALAGAVARATSCIGF